MKLLAELNWQFVGLPLLIERDRIANVVDDHLAGVAPGHVFLELFADSRVHRTVHVLIQHR